VNSSSELSVSNQSMRSAGASEPKLNEPGEWDSKVIGRGFDYRQGRILS
jgi:hypothetical protein